MVNKWRWLVGGALLAVVGGVVILGGGRGQESSPLGIIEDIEFATYESAGETKSLQLDLYQPNQPEAGGWPVIIYIHGGGWEEHTRKSCPGQKMSQYGYMVACVSYRYSHEAIFPAQIYDVKAAVRWLRAHAEEYRLDPDRFGAMGPSAGGHLSALLGTSAGVPELEGDQGYGEFSSAVQAVVDWYGPTDFTQVPLAFEGEPTAEELERVKDRPWAHLTRMMTQLIGGPVPDHPTLVALANPISFVTSDDPPFQILHGAQDSIVPVTQSEILVAALQAQGVPVEFYRDEARGHNSKGAEGEAIAPEIMDRTIAFFDQYLKPGE